MSDSVWPHRRQPTRHPCPWDSPGKKTRVGCHFLLQCMKVKSERYNSVVSDPQRPHGLQPTRLLRPWDSPGKSTGVGCHCLLRIKMLQGKKKKERKTLGYSPEPYSIWKEVKFSLFKQNACPSLLLLTSISGETAWGKFLPVLSPCTSDYSTTAQT